MTLSRDGYSYVRLDTVGSVAVTSPRGKADVEIQPPSTGKPEPSYASRLLISFCFAAYSSCFPRIQIGKQRSVNQIVLVISCLACRRDKFNLRGELGVKKNRHSEPA